MTSRSLDPLQPIRLNTSTWAWLVMLLLAVFVYVFALGGQYAPTNGDELVYTHIARLTAASGHWLPLVSELDHMRNTKPPLLFWQAMVAGDWGNHWSLSVLRLPSLIYTLLIAGAVGWTVRQITGNLRTACLAACVYLAYFCTFRFGRTYLTSAPETFWLNLPLFVLLWHRLRTPRAVPVTSLSWLIHAGFGVALGLGLAYKSFALIAPAAATLWCAQLLSSPVLNWRVVIQTTLKVSLSAVIALGIFALWFVLDPDPAAVWQEFVIGENAGKMGNSAGYWQTALRGGGFSMWAQLLAYVQNAGLLAFVALGLIWVGLKTLRQRLGQAGAFRKLSPYMVVLMVWLAVWLIVFTLPSQRSARYVIPAMPALAMMMALLWTRIARGWFVLSLLLCGIFIGVLGRIAWAAHDVGMGSRLELAVTMLVIAISLGVVSAGLLKPGWTRTCTLAATLAVYACFSFTTMPLNGPSGQYAPSTVAALRNARVAVPNGFNGQFERFQFLLPGNRFEAYDLDDKSLAQPGLMAAELTRLLSTHDAVVWWQSQPSEHLPACAPACSVLGARWEVKGRHQSGEITLANLWYPQTWLFRREWVVTGAKPPSPSRQP